MRVKIVVLLEVARQGEQPKVTALAFQQKTPSRITREGVASILQ